MLSETDSPRLRTKLVRFPVVVALGAAAMMLSSGSAGADSERSPSAFSTATVSAPQASVSDDEISQAWFPVH